MMVYFDTNIYIYAFCQNVDNTAQKEHSQKLLRQYASTQELVISEIVLYEFAFISKKLGEDKETIQKNLAFLSKYVKDIDNSVHKRVLEIFDKMSLYHSSFDVFHLAFCENNQCKLLTFDKGFKKLQEIAKVEIEIFS